MSMNPEKAIICPNCHTALPKAPSRKSKCPMCANDIYVNSKQTLFPQSLITKEQADAIHLIEVFGSFADISNETFWAKSAELDKRFGQKASVSDVVWTLYNELLETFGRKNDYTQLSAVYYQMANIRASANQDSQRLVLEANKATLRHFMSLNTTEFEVESSYNCCPACKKLDGKKYKLDKELIEQPPLPPPHCDCRLSKTASPMCVCLYIATVFR